MASLRKRGKTWYYRFTDADGVKREAKGCTDRRATEELARAAESEAAKFKAGLIGPGDLARREHGVRPIAEHVRAWTASLEARRLTRQHIDEVGKRTRRIVALVPGAEFSEIVPRGKRPARTWSDSRPPSPAGRPGRSWPT